MPLKVVFLYRSCAPFVLRWSREESTERKRGILNRQNEVRETLCSLFPIYCRIPKLDVACSIPVSRSMFSITYSVSLDLNTV